MDNQDTIGLLPHLKESWGYASLGCRVQSLGQGYPEDSVACETS